MIAAVTCSALALVALPGGLVVGANTLLNDSGGDSVNETAATIPMTPVELLAVVSPRGEVASLALLALSPSGAGGTIVSIPVGAAADVAEGEPLRRIVDGFAAGGLDSVRAEVEDLTNITVNLAAKVTHEELTVLLGSVGSRSVNLAAPVKDSTADGTVVTVLEAGEQTVTPGQIAQALASSAAGVAESVRLPQVRAMWGAVAGAAVAAPTQTTTSLAGGQSGTGGLLGGAGIDSPVDTAGFLSVLLSGPVDVWQFAATLITDPQRNPSQADMYAVDSGEVLMVMASVAPSALALTSNDIAVMLDIPFNDSSLAKEAVTRLAFLGANVVLVRRITDPPAEKTVVHYNDVLVRVEVEEFATLIGPLEFVETTEQIEGVNARIVLGNDFLRHLGGADPVTTTTTTTVPG